MSEKSVRVPLLSAPGSVGPENKEGFARLWAFERPDLVPPGDRGPKELERMVSPSLFARPGLASARHASPASPTSMRSGLTETQLAAVDQSEGVRHSLGNLTLLPLLRTLKV